MSYCRFENTLADLEDCAEALYEIQHEDLELTNRIEQQAARELIKLCDSIYAEFKELEFDF